jgi:CheY-like chemotaxis protein
MAARILVIEDNAESLEVMTCLLEAFGHTTFTACDGEQGLKVVSLQRPDLIICDLQLPGMSGFAVCRQLKNDPLLSSIPLVAVTAQAMVGDRERVLEAGFNGYISKPIAPRGFVEQVESYIGHDKDGAHG